ncbi:N-acetylmuramic acid 6-phosphate etherase [Sphaerochaeta pleomorpha str. Grapes]|uniref:N-acetylmuramic acid 6-phosphate etherase n=1 Tax=Sphaerochaeta pleomorpha (strain ATCC BAA-1885 / DSM 22778 / Grapes) TaxID=158190 RepID=G8QT48_SPHPG|nr:N-acetylmuramic acid 6-phosphate etherase [Sphaerochaeta pleomorpha]AEV27953.1 N-acetylmuramic acid 6-phosphate etherase [Sphaerochaeta pleomorpha str. Grapes]
MSLPTTEQRNPASYKIDTKSTLEILEIINKEDEKVPLAVRKMIPTIASLVDDVVVSFKKGGRLFYIGAGTSGRLGVLDASECPPTFGVSPSMVQGLIAGGLPALTSAIEAAEDNAESGIIELKSRGFTKDDVLVGITASGQAPYVLGAMMYAQGLGAKVGAISCNEESKVFNHADHKIYLAVEPEIITGSTRMKSGTAQKLVLNMITTTAMIRIGKVYNNLMVDLMPLNAKLVDRAKRLIKEITDCSEDQAEELYVQSGGNVKVAVLMSMLQVSCSKAKELLDNNEGSINKVLDQKQK